MPIGNLRETALHAALKTWYARPGDELEAQVAGYFIDLRRGDLLIEIQTQNFSAIKRKLVRLLEAGYAVRLVHPVAREKYIVRQDKKGHTLSRRKSPKRETAAALFDELVSLPDLAAHPQFSLEIVLTREEEISRQGRGGSWRRRGWKIVDRRLLDVLDRVEFTALNDYAAFLPATLPEAFTTRELAALGAYPLHMAQKITYCLRRMGVLEVVGKRRQATVYEQVSCHSPSAI